MREDLEMYENFKIQFLDDLKNELNIYEDLSLEEVNSILLFIIEEYENEFKEDFSEIFIYNYYQNFLNNVIDELIDFITHKKPLNNNGKDEILKLERKACGDVLYLYDFDFKKENGFSFISKITNNEIPINYKVAEIITNDDMFFIPPKGDPNLRGPHINYKLEYSLDYWLKFKEEIKNYIKEFEKNHSTNYIEDLKDYRYWLIKYRTLQNYLKEESLGGKNVKN